MKTLAKYALAILVIVALSLGLCYIALYLLYFTLLICLFYKGAMFFLIGATFTGFATWAALRIFDRHKVYSIKKGVHYETTH